MIRATRVLCGVGAAAAVFASGCTGLAGARATEMFTAAKPAAATAADSPSGELPAPAAAGLALNMAEQLDRGGKDTEAIPYYEKARQLNPALGDRIGRRLAVLYDRADDQSRAMTEFAAALKAHPKDANLLNDVGYSYYNRGRWAEAETYLRRAVDADRKHTKAWTNLGMALAQQNKYDDALTAFGTVAPSAEAQANLAFVFGTQGKKDEARMAYRRALEIDPTLRVAQGALARMDAPPIAKQPAADAVRATAP